MQKLVKPTEGQMQPGAYLRFRHGDEGRVDVVHVQPRGPLGQIMVEFLDGPMKGCHLATGWRELFVEDVEGR